MRMKERRGSEKERQMIGGEWRVKRKHAKGFNEMTEMKRTHKEKKKIKNHQSLERDTCLVS